LTTCDSTVVCPVLLSCSPIIYLTCCLWGLK
jgi:hypothetical protein